MGMSSYILDQEEKFWDKAESLIGECESFNEFLSKMKPYENLLQGTQSADDFEDSLHHGWQDFWSDKYGWN